MSRGAVYLFFIIFLIFLDNSEMLGYNNNMYALMNEGVCYGV